MDVKRWLRAPYRWLALRFLGLNQAGRQVSVYLSVRVRNPGQIVLADEVHILWRSDLYCGKNGRIEIDYHCRVDHDVTLRANDGYIRLGRHVYVGPFSILRGDGGIDIGNDVLISNHVTIMSANHIYQDPSLPIRKQGDSREGILIGDDVWVGAGATILDGVNIGRGAVVGAGAVVTRSVPAYALVAGVPARIIGHRTDEQQEYVLQSCT